MINKDVLIYSSVAGELPNIFREHKAMTFVEWEDYAELKKYTEILELRIKELSE